MRLGQILRPKEPRHLRATVVASLALLAVCLIGSRFWQPWSPSRGAGLALGFAAAVLFLLDMAYSSRRLGALHLRSGWAWLQAHIYLGSVGLLAALMHSGLAWPRGGFGLWLLVLAAWTTASGWLGVFLQKWIPLALAEGLRV